MRDKQQTQVFNSVLCRHGTCVCGEAIKCTSPVLIGILFRRACLVYNFFCVGLELLN